MAAVPATQSTSGFRERLGVHGTALVNATGQAARHGTAQRSYRQTWVLVGAVEHRWLALTAEHSLYSHSGTLARYATEVNAYGRNSPAAPPQTQHTQRDSAKGDRTRQSSGSNDSLGFPLSFSLTAAKLELMSARKMLSKMKTLLTTNDTKSNGPSTRFV